ncbi:hypothetical protein K8Z49_23820 [Actinomadura madurae]
MNQTYKVHRAGAAARGVLGLKGKAEAGRLAFRRPVLEGKRRPRWEWGPR